MDAVAGKYVAVKVASETPETSANFQGWYKVSYPYKKHRLTFGTASRLRTANTITGRRNIRE